MSCGRLALSSPLRGTLADFKQLPTAHAVGALQLGSKCCGGHVTDISSCALVLVPSASLSGADRLPFPYNTFSPQASFVLGLPPPLPST